MSWTREQFLDRAAFIEVQIAKWRGTPAYADTLRMELFALKLAADCSVTSTDSAARLSASEVACYRWPEDTAEHRAMRAAFCDGAAHIAVTRPESA